jgi:hypothetical protein
MTLKDEISKRLQGIQGAMSKFISVANEIGDLGQKFERLGRNMTILGAAITGPFVLALRNAAQYSIPVKKEMENLTAVSTAFQVQIAEAVVPIVQKFTNILGNLYSAFTKLSPETRTAVLQGVMMVGVYGTLAGVVLNLTGRMMKLVQQTAGLGAILAAISPVQKVLLIIIASLIVLISLWDQLKVVAIPILNLIETALYLVATALADVYMIIFKVFELLIRVFQGFYTLLSKIPGPTRKVFESISQGIKSVADEFEKGFNYQLSLANAGLEQMFGIWQDGQGSLAWGADNLAKATKGAFQFIKDAGNSDLNIEELKAKLAAMKDEAQEKFNAVKEIVAGTARAMQQSMGDFFFNALSGQLQSAQEMFANFGNTVLRILADVFAKILMIKAITILAGSSGTLFGIPIGQLFHEGGMIKKMHAGGSIRRAHEGMALASDEVPIIAQTGEGILSRKGMAAIGGEATLDRLNKGGGANQQAVNITPILVVKAFDAADILRHKRQIEGIIVDAIISNRGVRQKIKQYC